MDISQLIGTAVAGVDGRVEVASLEPVGIADRVAGDIAHIVSELTRNAAAFSGPGQSVTVNGVFLTDGYLVTISDSGIGISGSLLSALNRILDDPGLHSDDAGTPMGITAIARLAARHGVRVRLIPGAPGTTARVTLPLALVSRPAPVFAPPPEPLIDLARYEREPVLQQEHVVAMSPEEKETAERFLESVFGSLRGRTAPGRDRPAGRAPTNGESQRVRDPVPLVRHAALSMRVPGANFSLPEDDERSVASSEAAIDLRSALSRYEQGRRDAVD